MPERSEARGGPAIVHSAPQTGRLRSKMRRSALEWIRSWAVRLTPRDDHCDTRRQSLDEEPPTACANQTLEPAYEHQ